MSESPEPSWTFLTNHARVLICIAHDSRIRLREVGERVGITERAAYRIVAELLAAGYITRTRTGRRNQYTIKRDLPLPDQLAHSQKIGDLLAALAEPALARAGAYSRSAMRPSDPGTSALAERMSG